MDPVELPSAGTPLIGRQHELGRLRSALARVRRGRSAWIQLVGDPGIGKTRLLAELCRTAERQGCLVLTGRGTEFESSVPFGMLIDALDDHVATLGRERVRRLSRDRVDELAMMLPALGAGAARPASALGDERYRLHYAVRALLERMADPRPVVLALDDVHWADESSIELVAHLARRLPAAPVLLALAFRPRQAPERLTRALLVAEAAERIELGPLGPEAARALVGEHVPDARQALLYAESGGNPLFLEALAPAFEGHHPLVPGRVAIPDVPPVVLAALAEEVGTLSPTALTVARAAAIAGDPFTPELAAATAGVDEPGGLAALDELVTSGLVLGTEIPRQFRFRHPIVRRAVYATAGAGWRLAAHGRAAAALERLGAPAAVRAHHVELCAQPGDEAAIGLLASVAQDAAGRAPAAAAEWWAAAHRLLPADATPERRLELLVPRATALGAAGQLVASRDALREVLRLLPHSLPAVRGRVVAFIALIEQLLGHQDEAHDLLRRALAAQPDPGSAEATALRIELANERFFVADRTSMRDHAIEAFAAARALNDPPLLASAAGMLALAEYHVARTDRAAARLDEAAALLDSLSDEQLAGRLDAALFTGWGEQSLERWERSEQHMARGLAVARSTGQGYLLVPMTIGRAIAVTWQGDLCRAAELADETVDASLLAANDQSLAWTLTLRCWIATLAGDLPDAIRFGEQAVETAGGLARTWWGALAGCYLAEARLEAGDGDAAGATLLRAAGGPELPLIERGFQARWYEILTRAELACGRVSEAARWAGRAEASARGLGMPGRTSEALRAGAAVQLARGDAAGAARAALAAAEAAARPGNRIDHGRALALAGTALAAAGSGERAKAELQRAEAILDACGARRTRDQAARRLRDIGVPVARQGRRRRRPAAGIAALTDRERELAELVSAGHTNRDIAARLHLSHKTVETHLANIFAKLQMHSRAAVAGTIARAQPPPS